MSARLAVAGVAAASLLALSVPVALADSRVAPNETMIGPLRVRVYSMMCDGHGKPLHTRLNIRNTGGTPLKVLVQDSFANRTTYDPNDVAQPGFGILVHLTSSRSTPAHTLSVITDVAKGTVSIPKSPCTSVPTTDPTNPPTKPTNPPTKPTIPPTGPTNPPTIPPVNPGGGPPVAGPGVVNMPGGFSASAGGGGSGAVQRAASGTLPFTGSDMRLYALLGNLLVLVGFGLLLLSHRKRHGLALFNKLTPQPIPVDPS